MTWRHNGLRAPQLARRRAHKVHQYACRTPSSQGLVLSSFGVHVTCRRALTAAIGMACGSSASTSLITTRAFCVGEWKTSVDQMLRVCRTVGIENCRPGMAKPSKRLSSRYLRRCDKDVNTITLLPNLLVIVSCIGVFIVFIRQDDLRP